MVATRSSKTAARPRADFFSHPSEDELIARYLLPRVSSQNKSFPFIHDANVYSLEPAKLTNDFAPALASNGDRAWYFFSAVRAKSREGQRKVRTVDSGEGCWHSEAGAKPVVVEPHGRLGHRQSFSFVTKVDGRRVRLGWLMVELGLNGTDEMVLCKIYFSPRAHQLAGATPALRKRKAVDDKNQAPVRQIRPPTDAAAPPHANDNTAVAEQKDDGDTQGGGIVDEKSVADDDNVGVSIFSSLLPDREECLELGYADRPDEEIRADLGLQEMYALLDGATKELEELPSYDTAGDTGYPACLTWEDLYSTEPLWFEGYKRGYSRSRIHRH